MRIAARIWSGIGIVLAGFALTVAVGAWQGMRLERILRQTQSEAVSDALAMKTLVGTYAEARRHYQDACLSQDQEILKEGHQHAEAVDAGLRAIAERTWAPAEVIVRLREQAAAVVDADAKAKDVYGRKAANAKDAGLDEQVAALTRHIDERIIPGMAAADAAVAAALNGKLAEVEQALRRLTFGSLAIFLIAVAISSVMVSLIIRRSVIRPLRILSSHMDEIAGGGGDLTRRIPVAERADDELSRLGLAFNRFLDHLQQLIAAVGASTQAVGASAASLDGLAKRVSATSADTLAGAQRSADGARQVSQDMQTLAAAVEEMLASIKEISQRAQEASSIAGQAATGASGAEAGMKRLTDASAAIDQVVKLINQIAGKTNLLALNATIEAARAGEAGRGFAVVASEVKELSRQTGGATQEVQTSIGAIQAQTGEAGAAIHQIAEIVNRISEASISIASAVEQQSATTQEISNVVSGTMGRAKEIGDSVAAVSHAADSTAGCAKDTEQAAAGLARAAADLQALVGKFRY